LPEAVAAAYNGRGDVGNGGVRAFRSHRVTPAEEIKEFECTWDLQTLTGEFEVHTVHFIYDLAGYLVRTLEFTETIQKKYGGNPNNPAGGSQQSDASLERISISWDYLNGKGRRVSAGGYLIFTTVDVKDRCAALVQRSELGPIKRVVHGTR